MENHLKTTFYSSPDIWSAINKIVALPENIQVASPFLSDKVQFDWKHGDSLLIALSEVNVRKGFVNPFTVEELIDKGVKVFSNEKLHAKIYSNSNQAIICSCNLSFSSQHNWLEAGVLVTDTTSLASVKIFFEENLKDTYLISKESLVCLKDIFKLDVVEVKEQKKELELDGNVWSVSLTDAEKLDENITKKIRESRTEVEGKQNDLKYYYFRTPKSEFKKGDYIIQFRIVDGKMKVYFPAQCIKVSKISEILFVVHLAHKSGYNFLEWEDLKQQFVDLELEPVQKKINKKQQVLERLYYYFNK